MNGNITTGGQLAVSDPCYEDPDIILTVKPGEWEWFTASELKNKAPEQLWAHHKDHSSSPDTIDIPTLTLCVDSGTMGIRDVEEEWDNSRITREMFPDYHDSSQWNLSLQYSDKAMVSSTFWGDGVYPLYVKKNAVGDIIALRVDFLGTQDEDDNDDW